MSAIASATLLAKSCLPLLQDATAPEHIDEILDEHGRALPDYDWSGYVVGTALTFLSERGVELTKSEHDSLSTRLSTVRDTSCYILTAQHKQLLPRLSPDTYSAEELCDYFNELNAADETEVGQPMLDGIAWLRDIIAALDDDHVAIINIG